jgi:alpha-tubulin suppressor-like RCC1 family protein
MTVHLPKIQSLQRCYQLIQRRFMAMSLLVVSFAIHPALAQSNLDSSPAGWQETAGPESTASSQKNQAGSTAARSAGQSQRFDAGYRHSLLIDARGWLWSWGLNSKGQLGVGHITNLYFPGRVNSEADWVEVSAGEGHSLAIKSDGTLWSWGNNTYGQLGDGSATDRVTPGKVGSDADWVAVSAGGGHSLALKNDGTLWAWGRNDFGQLGTGNNTNQPLPVQIGTANNWTAVDAGSGHNLALRNDGSLWSWGQNNGGQLGLGSTTHQNAPVQVASDTNWSAIAAGGAHSLARKSDGTLWSWGYNWSGELGIGNTIMKLAPVKVGTASDWTSVAAGNLHSLAQKSDGTLWAWGNNSRGQVGNGSTTNKTSPVQIGSATQWSAVAAGIDHNLAIASDGSLWRWGDDYYGELGLGPGYLWGNSGSWLPTTRNVPNGWKSVALGLDHSVATGLDRRLWVWGYDGQNQLGFDYPVDVGAPNPVSHPSEWIQMGGGETHSAGIQSDGTLWAWGGNGSGELGQGDVINRTPPTRIGSDSNWRSLTTGRYHNFGIRDDSSLWAWGNNENGQLGLGHTTNQISPVQIVGGAGWKTVAASQQHSLGIRVDGTLWAWGNNGIGQLGTGDLVNRTSPVQVDPGSWRAVATGYTHNLAIKSDGTLWAWGYNGSGQVGDGSSSNWRTTPIQISQDTNWTSISGGAEHSLAVRADGTLWAWGRNLEGQLGLGSLSTSQNTPIQVGLDRDWSEVVAGQRHGMAIKSDGSLWAWGQNDHARLGNANLAAVSTPSLAVMVLARPQLHTLTVSATHGKVRTQPAGIDCGTGAVACSTSHYAGAVLEITPTAVAGSTFTGWSGDCSGNGSCIVTLDAAKSVTASFTQNSYAITASASPTAGGTVSCTPNPVTHGASSTCTATPNTGYAFSAFSGDCSGASCVLSNVTSARSVTASFTQNSYAITATASPTAGGTVSCTPNPVTHGASSTCTATPNAGYTFSAFSGDCSGASCVLSNVTAAKSVTANFAVALQTQTIGSIEFSPSTLAINGTTTVSATASSGLTVAFTSSTPTICTVSGNTVAGEASGTCTIAANQAGNESFLAAPQVTQNITVTKANQTIGPITFPPSIFHVGTTTEASATASSGLAVTFGSSTPDICSVSGNTVTGVTAGNCTITADQPGNDTFAPAAQVVQTLAVAAANPPRLLNIATRGKVETVDNVMIAGFIIQGSSAKKVLIRARGPSLAAAPFNVPGTLADPFLTLYSGATPIDTNDDFAQHANAAQIPADWTPASAKEAAIVTTLSPGAYTAIVNGVGATSGVAIVEVFELDQPGTPLINIATRGPVQTGDNVMIAGLIIQGDAPKTVLITARGPSMAGPPHNVPGTLSDPVLTLFSGQTPIASNDNWPQAANAAQIQTAIGAPTNTQESAILITLQPGAYTAIVNGASNATGLGIVEVFAQ